MLDPFNSSKSNSTYYIYQATTGFIIDPRSTAERNSQNGRYIASSQGFFVRAFQNGSLQFDESIKPISPYSAVYGNFREETSPQEFIKITVSDSVKSSQAIIHFKEDAEVGFDSKYDAECISSGGLVLYTLQSGKKLSINGFPQNDSHIKIPLIVENIKGKALFNFSGLTEASNSYFLKDNYLNRLIRISVGSPYSFSTSSSDTSSLSKKRFEVIQSQVTGLVEKEDYNSLFTIYTTPTTTGVLNLRLFDLTTSSYEIIDVNGRIIIAFDLTNNASPTIQIDLQKYSLPAGPYAIRCINGKGSSIKSFIISK